MAPTLVTSCTSLPPEGAVSAWGGPTPKRIAPTLVISCTSLPPRGLFPPWAARRGNAASISATIFINAPQRGHYHAKTSVHLSQGFHAQALHRQQELLVLVHAPLGPAQAGGHRV
ncbi:3-coathanger stack domain-containing protein [Polaromonas sp.]|uniref:3-coathanger stack domain-containing protein n=1 Tax=Polaromonas sp. TaxID=1869339 RepID=UPI003FA7B64C